MPGDQARILLLTNDDGVEAPGIGALVEATKELGRWRVVAPCDHSSGCSHAVTTHGPIAITQRPDGRTAVAGSPADCVRVALFRLEPSLDWVISGINAGGNLGGDLYHSGTVAAVREASLRGRPGIAVSHYIARNKVIDWKRAAQWTTLVLHRLLEMPWEPGTFWNVNLPHLDADASAPEVVFCPVDPSPLPLDFRFNHDGGEAHYSGDYQSRIRAPGTDVDVCFGGRIAVSLVRL